MTPEEQIAQLTEDLTLAQKEIADLKMEVSALEDANAILTAAAPKAAKEKSINHKTLAKKIFDDGLLCDRLRQVWPFADEATKGHEWAAENIPAALDELKANRPLDYSDLIAAVV